MCGRFVPSGEAHRSQLWNQIKADCTGLPFTPSSSTEPASLGAAILAGVGCGEFGSLDEACHAMVRAPTMVTPNPDRAPIYQAVARRYKKLYHSLMPYWT